MRVADVIRAADEMGATYPDVLQLLADASKQKNLPNAIAVEKLPEGGRAYYRPTNGGSKKSARQIKIGRDNYAPNIFPESDDPTETARRKEEEAREARHSQDDGPLLSVPSEQVEETSELELDSKSEKKKPHTTKKVDKSRGSWNWFGGKK